MLINHQRQRCYQDFVFKAKDKNLRPAPKPKPRTPKSQFHNDTDVTDRVLLILNIISSMLTIVMCI